MLSERIIDKTLDKNIPLSASMELTYRCNNKCVMCYQPETCSEELTTEEIENILTQLAEHGCLYLTFTGGEPLLRQDFWQIAEFARAKSFAVNLLTNGTLIGREEAEKIKKLNFLQVHISILGKDAKTHDAITDVSGSFEKAISGAGELVAQGVNVVFKTTLMKENIAQYKEIEKLAESTGALPFFSPVIFPKNDMEQGPLSHRITDEDLK
ncbi:radical SAM protein, partial [Thermodesulfobacteriota bacterium]